MTNTQFEGVSGTPRRGGGKERKTHQRGKTVRDRNRIGAISPKNDQSRADFDQNIPRRRAFSHKNLLKDHEKLQKEAIDLRLSALSQKTALEKESGEAKRHILELQHTYKETLLGHQSIIKRLTDENSLMTGLLTAKETELRELDSLERNMESQLSSSLLTIQKLDHALKQIRNVREVYSGKGTHTRQDR